MPSRIAAVLALALMLAACGEPPVPLEVPERGFSQAVLDVAGIVDEDERAFQQALGAVRRLGWDPVVIAFEAEGASMGMADRAGRKVLDAWGADLALVAVAEPGHFDRSAAQRKRYFGLFARDVREVPRGVRERIVEEVVPPIAGRNAWTAAYTAALRALADGLGDVDGDAR